MSSFDESASDDALFPNAWPFRKIFKYLLLTMLALSLLSLPFIGNGFFREQGMQKRARTLIEKGGYAYCAIWGDKTDPFQLMAMNSPLRPRWTAEKQNNGNYLMTFSYVRSGKAFSHQWEVNLVDERVTPVSDHSSVPIDADENEKRCSEN